jgi:hypothetical protein
MVGPGPSPEGRLFLEEEFWRDTRAQAVLVSPILIDAASIGVALPGPPARPPGDYRAGSPEAAESFRDLAVIALRLSSQRGQGGAHGLREK